MQPWIEALPKRLLSGSVHTGYLYSTKRSSIIMRTTDCPLMPKGQPSLILTNLLSIMISWDVEPNGNVDF